MAPLNSGKLSLSFFSEFKQVRFFSIISLKNSGTVSCAFCIHSFIIIKYCKKQEIKLALVSSTSKNNIDSIFFCLRDSLNKKDFDFIGNSKLVKKLKPSAEIYKLALKELKLKPKECIAIEDTQVSLNSAVKAKLKCFIFPGNFHRSKKFNGAFKEISKINKNIFKS